VRFLASNFLKRFLALLIVLLGVLTIIFAIPHWAPGGPERALIGWPYTAERAASLREHYGFDRSLDEQYKLWLYNLVSGEWGKSKFTGRPIMREVLLALPLTLKLLAETVALAVIIGSLMALIALYPWDRPYTGRGQGIGVMAMGLSDFYFGILIKFFFVWHLEWFPVGGFAFFSEQPWLAYRQLLLPSLSVGVLYGLLIGPRVAARLARAHASQEDESFAFTSLHQRQGGWLVVSAVGHSVVMLLQHSAFLLGSVMLAEKIFTIPGFGDFGIDAFVRRDYPKIQAFLVVMVGTYAIVHALVGGLEAARQRRLLQDPSISAGIPPPKSRPGLGGLIMHDGFFLGAVMVLALVATILFAGHLAPFLPDEVHMKDRLQPPTTQYWMGSDLLGRDILSRIIYGGRQALLISAAGATGALALGLILGGMPRLGRHVGIALVTPLVEMLEAFPPLILAMMMMTLLGQGYWQEIVALTAGLAPLIAGVFLRSRPDQRPRFLIPAGLLAGTWLKACGVALILEATLNFLDIGLLPLIPSWGGDLKANLPYLHVNPAIVLFPGMAVVMAALGFHLMADSVRKHTKQSTALSLKTLPLPMSSR
jgi:ABC-type dipeptide/oligopeptide/nickel transport system permease component/ABC-type dipeptide/oligopeptide/nickel transport system permease subunit